MTEAGAPAATLPSRDGFAAVAGQPFAVQGAATTVLTLVEVVALPDQSQPGLRRDPFALRFLGESAAALGQGTVRLVHPSLGTLDIFIVPIGRDGDGLVYEAVFN